MPLQSSVQPRGDIKGPTKPAGSFVMRDFKGLNTQDVRTAIEDGEFSWIENLQPIGYANLLSVPGPGTPEATIAGGIVYMKYVLIGTTDYLLVATADGKMYSMNLTTNAVTQINGAYTFTTPYIIQWKTERALIIDPTYGYFSWDGTTMTGSKGVVAVAVAGGGTGYSVNDILTLAGGAGSGATAKVTAASGGVITTVVVNAPGTNYTADYISSVTGGTGTGATISVTVLLGPPAGGVTSVTVQTAGTGYAVNDVVTLAGGTGSGATAKVMGVDKNGGVAAVAVYAPGIGYVATYLSSVTGGTGTGAKLTATVLTGSAVGTTMAVYAGRVWVSNGRVVSYTGPDDFAHVGGASPAGSFTVYDSDLRQSIYAMEVANNFLYLFGDSAVYIIGDVRVDSTTGFTLFSRVLLETDIGTLYKTGVTTLDRVVVVTDIHGVYGLYGSTPRRISAPLDGIYGNIDFTQAPTIALAKINQIQCAAILFKYNDATGPTVVPRALLFMWFDDKWFLASQGDNITFVTHAMDKGVDVLYGTDGANIFHLFDSTEVPVATKLVTKLFDFGNVFVDKALLKLGLEANVSVPTTFTVSVDSLTGSTVAPPLFGASTIIFVNNSGSALGWLNNSSQPIVWIASGNVFLKTDAQGTGKYLGYTITTTSQQFSIVGLLGEYREGARW